jgi:hypothetical protein
MALSTTVVTKRMARLRPGEMRVAERGGVCFDFTQVKAVLYMSMSMYNTRAEAVTSVIQI